MVNNSWEAKKLTTSLSRTYIRFASWIRKKTITFTDGKSLSSSRISLSMKSSRVRTSSINLFPTIRSVFTLKTIWDLRTYQKVNFLAPLSKPISKQLSILCHLSFWFMMRNKSAMFCARLSTTAWRSNSMISRTCWVQTARMHLMWLLWTPAATCFKTYLFMTTRRKREKELIKPESKLKLVSNVSVLKSYCIEFDAH